MTANNQQDYWKIAEELMHEAEHAVESFYKYEAAPDIVNALSAAHDAGRAEGIEEAAKYLGQQADEAERNLANDSDPMVRQLRKSSVKATRRLADAIRNLKEQPHD